ANGETEVMYLSTNGFTLADQIIFVDFRFAKLVRKMRTASPSVESPCGAPRSNGLSRSLKKRAAQFFTIPDLLTAVSGRLASTISPLTSVLAFDLICRSVLCASITDIHCSATDITVVVVSTST